MCCTSAMLAHQHLLKLSELKQKYSFKNDNNSANYLWIQWGATIVLQ